ncbi:hypothetical protein L7F22_060216 [Adiantum nelumboides]|nr:hypothetical protein [Adiantum nelumboides]
MLGLASHLAALGCTITFLAAEKTLLAAAAPAPAHPPHVVDDRAVDVGNVITNAVQHYSIGNANETSVHSMPSAINLHFHSLPYTRVPSKLTESSPRFDIFKETLAVLEDRQEMMETMVQELKLLKAPIACVICDILLCSWVVPLAKRQTILSAVLVSCSFTNFYLPYLQIMQREKNKQENNSVLLVSFGSESSPDAEQVQELAMGIEASGCKFLWVVRPDSERPPKGSRADADARCRDVCSVVAAEEGVATQCCGGVLDTLWLEFNDGEHGVWCTNAVSASEWGPIF